MSIIPDIVWSEFEFYGIGQTNCMNISIPILYENVKEKKAYTVEIAIHTAPFNYFIFYNLGKLQIYSLRISYVKHAISTQF